VAFGANGLAKGKAMKLLVNTCTISVPFVKEIEQAMAAQGITVVDCPISNGPPGARAGTLSVMVSGNPAAVERIRPIISLWGTSVPAIHDFEGETIETRSSRRAANWMPAIIRREAAARRLS